MSGGVGLFGVSLMTKIIRGDWVVWRSGIIWRDGIPLKMWKYPLDYLIDIKLSGVWYYLEVWDYVEELGLCGGVDYVEKLKLCGGVGLYGKTEIMLRCGIRCGIMWRN